MHARDRMIHLLRLSLLLLGLGLLPAITGHAQAVYEARVDRDGPNQGGKRYSPPVEIVKLSDAEQKALLASCGGDFKQVTRISPKPTAALPWYPYEMRRRGETASVKCLIEVNPDGKVARVYRLGSDSDPFFVECARALVQWKFKAAEQPRFYRITLSAIIASEPP